MARKKADYYVFFVGGSGARVCKAFLHACAAGAFRSEEIKVLLLDADSENPACQDCLRLYKKYESNRAMFHSESAETAQRTPLFQSTVKMYHEDGFKPKKWLCLCGRKWRT